MALIRAHPELAGKAMVAKTLTADDRHKIYEGNARRVFPRLDAALKAKGQ